MYLCRLYLVAFLGLVLSPCIFGYATIIVSSNGKNEEACITGINKVCKTLDYALQKLSLVELETKDVTLIVEYSHTVQLVNISYSFHLNITVLGVGEPTMYCGENTFLHFSDQEEFSSVAVSFDGISFSGCNGYWNEAATEWVTGFAFLNFDIISFTKVIITKSSDVYFARNRHVSISQCRFNDMVYHHGAIYIYDNLDSTRNLSNNTISQSIFTGNIGKVNTTHNQQLAVATVSASVATDNLQMMFILHVSDCMFQENQIIAPNASQTVSEIGVIVHNAALKSFEVTVDNSLFDNHSALSSSKMVSTAFSDSQLETFSAHVELNNFTNNNLTETSELVSMLLTDITLQSPAVINYNLNNITGNEGVGLRMSFVNVSKPGSISIQDNIFEKNYGEVIHIHCDGLSNPAESLIVTSANNEICHNAVSLTKDGIMVVHEATLYLINDSFYGNTGTALFIKDTLLHMVGKIKFAENAGKYGGGLGMYGLSELFANGAFADVSHNRALYGGGIYIGVEQQAPEKLCLSFINENCEFVFNFTNNKASSNGNNVYFVDKELATCTQQFLHKCLNITDYSILGFGSSVVTIQGVYGNTGNDSKLQIFPGQNIIINSTVFDAFNVPSTCIATVFLQCYDQLISCESDDGQFIQLEGPTSITLGSSTYTSNIKLLAPSNISSSMFDSPSLRFKCGFTSQYTLNLDFTECPLGFVYNETSCTCQCALKDHSGFLCSVQHGKACVAKGYWLGAIEKSNGKYATVILHCRFQFCRENAKPCPDTVGQDATSSYILVGSSEDSQCESNHGGIMCASCRKGATFTFEGIHCIDNEECQPWQPYVLLFLVIMFQFVLAYVIQLFLSIQTFCGIGFLFGPLFYVAVINTLPFAYYQEYYHLKTMISVYTSIFLLNMEVFGQVKWCFFQSFSLLENYAFHYLGPFIVVIVLITTVLIARKCPKLQNYLHISPLQTVCLLLLLSFWSLSETSTRIIQWVNFPGVKQPRVSIQPDLYYFAGQHIPFMILSLLIAVFIVYPFILILLLAPFISRKIFSLYRIQPLLDQFQSSYRDNFRWYPAVYMIGWTIIIAARNEALVVQAVLAIMISMSFTLQPYKAKWLNITDTFLLLDIILIDALLSEHDNPYYDYTENQWVKPVFVFLISLLSILPFVYITIGSTWIILMKFKVDQKLKRSSFFQKSWRMSSVSNDYLSDHEPINDESEELPPPAGTTVVGRHPSAQNRVSRQLVQMTDSADEYREPLVVLLQEEERQAAAAGYGTK